jgi:hypothetical protein
MKIRITGLPAETERALNTLNAVPEFDVINISGPYPNRGASRLVRVYAEIQFTQWCDRSWHDGDCCEGSRQQPGIQPLLPQRRKELPQ